jgi:hypothetical protein
MTLNTIVFRDFYGSDDLDLSEADFPSRVQALNAVSHRSHALERLNAWASASQINILTIESICKTVEPDGIQIDGIRVWTS